MFLSAEKLQFVLMLQLWSSSQRPPDRADVSADRADVSADTFSNYIQCFELWGSPKVIINLLKSKN